MRGPSSSGSRRSSSGQAAQLLDFSQHPQRAPAPPPARPTRAAPHRGQQRRTPRGEPGGCHLNLLLQKWKQSQKRQQEGNGMISTVCTYPRLLTRPGSKAGRRLLCYFSCDMSRAQTWTLCWCNGRGEPDFPVIWKWNGEKASKHK